MGIRSSRKFYSNIDWILILIFFLLVAGGLLSILSALYDGGAELPSRFINQCMWLGIAAAAGMFIILIDSKYLFLYSYHAYFLMLFLMFAVALFGKEVNGARSWISIGSFSVQPVEFMKIATILAISRYMSSYSFDITKLRDLFIMCSIIVAPVFMIFMQNDTGSALVFGSLLLMLYREGLTKWIYIAGISVISLFIAFFIIESFALISFIIIFTTFVNIWFHGDFRTKIKYLIILYSIYFALSFLFIDESGAISRSMLLVISFFLTLPLFFLYMRYRKGLESWKYISYIICSILFLRVVDFIFNNIMQIHQRKRILDLLGIENDIFGWGYNVNQSKIAIGSGGFFGKGFLNGTQTKFNFVPEQSTDFIFCTIGEEFGFIGTSIVTLLFAALILRLMHIGDRLFNSYSRIYCYSIASIFLFHIVINIGMTIGIAPVIGIPLPFFSYGGSSLLSFTIMLSIALKLNMDNFEKK